MDVRWGRQNDPEYCLVLDSEGHTSFEPVLVSLTYILLATGCHFG